MSGGFSLVLEKASYFELSCVTVVFQAVCCLDWLNPVSPNANAFDTWLDRSWNELELSSLRVTLMNTRNRVWVKSTWLNATESVSLSILLHCRSKAVSLCAYLHDLVSNNRVATEKSRQGQWHIWQRNSGNFCFTLDSRLVIASKSILSIFLAA